MDAPALAGTDAGISGESSPPAPLAYCDTVPPRFATYTLPVARAGAGKTSSASTAGATAVGRARRPKERRIGRITRVMGATLLVYMPLGAVKLFRWLARVNL
jgi:hypothetical protein